MPRATLVIDCDISALRRTMGEIPGITARAQAVMTGAARRGGRERVGIDRTFEREHESIHMQLARARERQAREATAKEKAEGRKQVQADAAFARERDSIHARLAAAKERREKEATRAAATEGRKRVSNDAQFAREHDSIHRRMMAAQMQRERQATRERRELGRRAAAVGGAVFGGVANYADAMHGQIQSARQQRAIADRSLGTAVRNAGGSDANVTATRTRVRQFVAETGMSYSDVASALATGQERGSSLEAGGGRTSAQALEEALSIVREANAEGADPGQYLAARGRLAAAGLRGDSLRGAMRFALGAAQSGQVEVDQLLQQGLPGASRLMDQRVSALGPGATDAQRQAAMLAAWRESVATQEVLAASGGNAGHTANTLASLQNFLSTPRRQEMALNNIRVAESQINTATPEGRAHAARLRALYEGDSALYERDTTRSDPGAMRLRAGVSAIEFSTRVAAASGGNAQAGANIFAGGGVGNAQAFLVNMRNLMGVLGGERGQRIQQMMAGAGLSDRAIADHQSAVENDDLSALTRAQETGANALTNNSDELVRNSNRLADLTARFPFQAQAVKDGMNTVKAVVSATGAGAVVARRAGLSIAESGGSTAARYGGRALGAVGRVAARFAGPVAAALDILTTNSNARGVEEGGTLEGNQMEAVRRARRAQHDGGGAGPVQVSLTPESAQAVGQHTATALQRTTITAMVAPDPHSAAHAASAAPPPAR
jgi:hypothetical protein